MVDDFERKLGQQIRPRAHPTVRTLTLFDMMGAATWRVANTAYPGRGCGGPAAGEGRVEAGRETHVSAG